MAQVIPKRVLEEIRFRNDIVDVIGSYLNIKKAGSTFRALCPFHKEKTPSFHVNQQKQIFHCFGCGAGGDVYRFVMQYESMDFITAAKMLAQRAGIRLELEEGEGDGSDKNLLFKINNELAEFYQRCLLRMKSAAPARQYLEKRKLPPEIVEEFLIGYAPDRWDSALKWAEDKKYPLELLETAGLILKSSKPDARSTHYDRFRNRIMFPIRDEQGRVIGFSGRAIDEKDKGAKYVNSPETPLFHKSRILYALDKARRNIVEAHEAIICEGQIDVIRCHQAGFKIAVASQGTAFTEDHIRMLKRYTDSVVLVFDPDHAGQDAAIKAAMAFMQAEIAVRVATLPKGEDPDAFIREKGAQAFQSILDSAQSAISFQISVLSSREDIDSEVGVMRIAKAVLQTIAQSPSAIQQAKLLEEAAGRLKIPVMALRDDLRKMSRRTDARASTEARESESGAETPPVEELSLCEHMIHVKEFPGLGTLVEKYLPLDMISNATCRALVSAALESVRTDREILDILRDEDDPSGELIKFVARLEVLPTKVVGADIVPEDAVKDLILRVWRRELRKERAELEKKKEQQQLSRTITHYLNTLGIVLNHDLPWEDACVIIETCISSKS